MLNIQYKIIDFHTHPFITQETNICLHKEYCNMSVEQTEKHFRAFNVDKICGSVISTRLGEIGDFGVVKALNDQALWLKDFYKGFYIPGFHIHPKFVKQSIVEIERMNKHGVKLIGELCPYLQGWTDFSDKNLWEILEVVENYKMMVSFHATGNTNMLKQMDETVRRFKGINFVGAHPYEGECFNAHLSRLNERENYYVDLSGSGIGRMGTLRHLIDEVGKERILFGSDYPISNLAMHIGGVALDPLITKEEKEYVFYKNAERLLKL